MDSDIGSLIQSVLSDPEQMAKLTDMAQGLLGGAAPEPEQKKAEMPDSDAKLLAALGKSLGGSSSRSTALLMAMRPYMKPEKQEKLDRAMKLSQMVRIAQTVMGQIGGSHGL